MLVADTSAVLAILKGEPGAAEAERLIRGGVIGMANVVEAVARGQDYGITQAVTLSALSMWGLEIAPVDRATGDQAMSLSRFRKQGLSLGGRLCLGLALARGLPALTCDRKWKALDHGVSVVLFR